MLSELFQQQQNYLNFFFKHIDQQRAQQVLDEMLECKGTIFFLGVGKSGVIAEKIATTLMSIGTKSICITPTNALHGDIGIVDSQDLVILLSKSGSSKELINLLPFLRQRKVKTIAWISNQDGELAKACDLSVHLPLEREICPFDLAPTTSAALQLIFGDILAIAMMRTKKFGLDDYARNHPGGLIGKKINLKVEDVMLKGDLLPICKLEDQLGDCLVELSNKKTGCLVVVDEQEMVRGIFTDGDLRRALQSGKSQLLNEKMSTLMTGSFLSISRNISLIEALATMQADPKKWVAVLPVIENERLVGIVRMHDIVKVGSV